MTNTSKELSTLEQYLQAINKEASDSIAKIELSANRMKRILFVMLFSAILIKTANDTIGINSTSQEVITFIVAVALIALVLLKPLMYVQQIHTVYLKSKVEQERGVRMDLVLKLHHIRPDLIKEA